MRNRFILIILLFSSCTQFRYPKFVHNSCTGKWAIRTSGSPEYVGYPEWRPVFSLGEYAMDTIKDAPPGREVYFDDSLSAVKYWKERKYRDSLDEIDFQTRKLIRDSIFKCHQYL